MSRAGIAQLISGYIGIYRRVGIKNKVSKLQTINANSKAFRALKK